MLSENSKPCNPNTSIESVTKDMTAFFPFFNNNKQLISILMRKKKGKWMKGGVEHGGGDVASCCLGTY